MTVNKHTVFFIFIISSEVVDFHSSELTVGVKEKGADLKGFKCSKALEICWCCYLLYADALSIHLFKH